MQRILSEAEHRVANLENRVLAGVTTHGEDHNHSIEHLEEELAKAQAHSREVDTLVRVCVITAVESPASSRVAHTTSPPSNQYGSRVVNHDKQGSVAATYPPHPAAIALH